MKDSNKGEMEYTVGIKDNIEPKLTNIAKEIGKALDNIGSKADKSFGEAASGASSLGAEVGDLTGGLSGVSGAAVNIGISAINVAADMDSAMGTYLASTGKSKEETERYQGVLENIYKNNYGRDFDDIAQSMAEVTKNMGDMDDTELQGITESALVLRDVTGGAYSVEESTGAAKAMMDSFGISGDDALSMIAAGYQKGLDGSGQLLDSVSQYSEYFGNIGLDADDMFNIMQKGAETGAFSVDGMGNAIKTMSANVTNGSETTREGFETMGLNADDMAAKFSAGGDSAKEAFRQTMDALSEIEDPMEQNAAGVALFGDTWEELGPEAVDALANIEEGAYDTEQAMEGMKEVEYDDLASMLEELGRGLEMLLLPLGEALMPILMTLIETVLPIVQELLVPLFEMIAALIEPIVSLVSVALQPLLDIFMLLMDTVLGPLIVFIQEVLLPVFTEVFGGIGSVVSGAMGTVMSILKGIIDFVKAVFAGDWGAAWDAVVGIFKSIWEGIKAVVKAPINGVIGIINFFIRGLNKIKLPKWLGGKGIHIDEIPPLKIGMNYVPSDDFPALLHEGEMVLTKKDAQELRSMGGVDGVLALLSGNGTSDRADRLAAVRDSAPVGQTNVYQTVNINEPVETPAETARALRKEAITIGLAGDIR